MFPFSVVIDLNILEYGSPYLAPCPKITTPMVFKIILISSRTDIFLLFSNPQ